MSVRVMSWVWESSASEGIDRLVLLAIADAASDHGGDAWPSVTTLASKAQVGVRTVQRAIRRLSEIGELEIRANAGRNGVNVYRVIMTPRHTVTPVNLTPPPESHPATQTPEGATQSPPPRHSDTQTVLEPSLPIQQNSSSDAPRPDVEHVCDYLASCIEANGSKRPTVTKRWRDSARLLIDVDKRSEQQILNAITWCQDDDFWRSNILSMPKLRDKYDQLRLSASRATGRASPKSTADSRVTEALALAQRLAQQETA